MNKTKIEWVKNPDDTQGFTWNPITGCLNGCEYCYARKLANGRLRSRYLANHNISTERLPNGMCLNQHPYDDPFYPRFWKDRLGIMPSDRDKPKGVFVCDMSDLFGIGIPEKWTNAVLGEIMCYWHHRFYLLTKQPQNLIKFSPFPDNCWVGVTATDAETTWLAIENLNRIEASVKYISFEPLLHSIGSPSWELNLNRLRLLDWVIIGSQTNPYKPPKMKWIDEIVQACDKAGIPIFLKNNLKPLFEQVFGNCRVFSSPAMDKQGNLRQEIPK